MVLALKKIDLAIPNLHRSDSFFKDLGMGSLQWVEFWSILKRNPKFRKKITDFHCIATVGEAIRYLQGERLGPLQPHERKNSSPLNWKNFLSNNGNGGSPGSVFPYSWIRKYFLRFFQEFSKHWVHLELVGLENLPPKGPFILTPNHESHLDNLFVACKLPEPLQKNMAVLAKKEHFENPLTKFWAHLSNAIPVDRENVTSGVLETCKELLQEGKILLIHPEGTRSPDGRLQPFKPGAALLALETHVPIIPVYIQGAFRLWPKNSPFPKLSGTIKIKIGKPLFPLSKKPSQSALSQAKRLNQKLRRHIESLGKSMD